LPKLWLIQKTLQFRRRHPELFGADGSYEPLFAEGDKAEHIVAFMRGGRAIAVVPRLVLRLANDWANTKLRLPEGPWFNELTGGNFAGGERAMSELLGTFPVALLTPKENT
jgi:(1->4)-alpha-D-glucan 1-alpha-D-glucosylmutase